MTHPLQDKGFSAGWGFGVEVCSGLMNGRELSSQVGGRGMLWVGRAEHIQGSRSCKEQKPTALSEFVGT